MAANQQGIVIGVSNRHIHLAPADLAALFGEGYQLKPIKDLQPGQFAAEEVITVIGPRGLIEGVRVIGPSRSATQVEISRTDAFRLGVRPPVRDSGDIKGSPGIILVGPQAAVNLSQGVILASRHIHMHTTDAVRYGLQDGDRVQVQVKGERAVILQNVLIRVNPSFTLEMHVDTDEANACLLQNGDLVFPVELSIEFQPWAGFLPPNEKYGGITERGQEDVRRH